MTAQPIGGGQQQNDNNNYEIEIPLPQGTTETELQNSVVDLRSYLTDEYNGATITFTYTIDYGDGSPIETIEKTYPFLRIQHQYEDNTSHQVNITLTTTLTINGNTYDHDEFYRLQIGKSKSKSKTRTISLLKILSERFEFLYRIF